MCLRHGALAPAWSLTVSGNWRVTVSGNWRVTFVFELGDVFEVDLVDYH